MALPASAALSGVPHAARPLGAARRTLVGALATALSGLALVGALPANAYAQQETGGPIVIPGNGERNPADAQALVSRIETSAPRRTAAQGATLTSLRPTPAAQRVPNGDEIVIPGNGEAAGQAAAATYAAGVVQGAPVVRTAAAYGTAYGVAATGAAPAGVVPAAGMPRSSNPAGAAPIGGMQVAGMPVAVQRVNMQTGMRQAGAMAAGSAPVRYSMPATQNQPVASAAYASAPAVAMADASAPVEIDPLSARGEPPQLGSAGGSTAAVKTSAPAIRAVAAATPQTAQAQSAQGRGLQAVAGQAAQAAQAAQTAQARPAQAAPTQAAQAAQAEQAAQARAQFVQQQIAAQLAQAQATRTNPRVVTVNAASGAAGANVAQGMNAVPGAAAVAVNAAVPAGQQDPESIRATAFAFLQQQTAGLPGKITITVSPAFARGLAGCTTLEPFMPVGARLWGRTSVGVRCAGARPWTIYLRANVSLLGTYYSAARQIAPGDMLTAADLVARDGDLATLPQAVITDPAQAVGAVALARIGAGLPLRQDLLRSATSVTIGQTVKVVAAGEGFSISAEGSVMNNASPGQQVRVKTANGQIVTGIVKDGSTVEIQL
jgi:flagellar basal body P-ring formation protein FlgA